MHDPAFQLQALSFRIQDVPNVTCARSTSIVQGEFEDPGCSLLACVVGLSCAAYGDHIRTDQLCMFPHWMQFHRLSSIRVIEDL